MKQNPVNYLICMIFCIHIHAGMSTGERFCINPFLMSWWSWPGWHCRSNHWMFSFCWTENLWSRYRSNEPVSWGRQDLPSSTAKILLLHWICDSGICLVSHTLIPWPWVRGILSLVDSCFSPSSLPSPLPHCSENPGNCQPESLKSR